jgi:hypothetical protein
VTRSNWLQILAFGGTIAAMRQIFNTTRGANAAGFARRMAVHIPNRAADPEYQEAGL